LWDNCCYWVCKIIPLIMHALYSTKLYRYGLQLLNPRIIEGLVWVIFLMWVDFIFLVYDIIVIIIVLWQILIKALTSVFIINISFSFISFFEIKVKIIALPHYVYEKERFDEQVSLSSLFFRFNDSIKFITSNITNRSLVL